MKANRLRAMAAGSVCPTRRKTGTEKLSSTKATYAAILNNVTPAEPPAIAPHDLGQTQQVNGNVNTTLTALITDQEIDIHGTNTDASTSTNLNNRTSITTQPDFGSPAPSLSDETFDKADMSTNDKTNSKSSMRRKGDRHIPNTDAGGPSTISIYQDD